jgi:hypothetical protein
VQPLSSTTAAATPAPVRADIDLTVRAEPSRRTGDNPAAMPVERPRTIDRVSEENRLEINWANALGGALAAVSAAVVLSTLGTAGTLIGAAIGSLCITIGSAVYSYSMRAAHKRLLAQRAMLARISAHRGAEGSGTRRLETRPEEDLAVAEAAPKESRVQMIRELPWKRIGAVSAAIFVVAMGVIVAFELTTGKTVSEWTGGSSSQGGTSVPGIGGGSESETPLEPDEDRPTVPEESPAEEPEGPEEPEESETPAPAGEEPTPTETVEPSPVETPTDVGTATP